MIKHFSILMVIIRNMTSNIVVEKVEEQHTDPMKALRRKHEEEMKVLRVVNVLMKHKMETKEPT